jgi:2-octaprenyl-6-methoxyphenol hydroxylase
MAEAIRCDVAIVGGGMVGATLACALSGHGLTTVLIEADPFDRATPASYDDRAIALAFGSRLIFEAVGLWPELASCASPIRRIHVSERGGFGFTRLDAQEEGVPALGYVLTARDLGTVLAARLARLPDVQVLAPVRLAAMRLAPEAAHLTAARADDVVEIATRLIVAADGARSTIRRRLGILAVERDYGHSAIIANVTVRRPHGGVAYERFTPAGPLALLPLDGDRFAVVWSVLAEEVEGVLEHDERQFLAELQDRFGWRAGALVRAGTRTTYPLRLVQARESVRHRLVVVGNAAHTLHPVAGQGFNLGLRDVATLAEVVTTAARETADIGDLRVLDRYAQHREADHRAVVQFTDGLARLFTIDLGPARFARSLGMLALDLLPWAKAAFARRAMGLTSRGSRRAGLHEPAQP